VALVFLDRPGDGYANTPETDLFLDRHKPSCIGGSLEMSNHRRYPFRGTAQGDLNRQVTLGHAHLQGFGVDLPTKTMLIEIPGGFAYADR
jgi:hypothetical protein